MIILNKEIYIGQILDIIAIIDARVNEKLHNYMNFKKLDYENHIYIHSYRLA